MITKPKIQLDPAEVEKWAGLSDTDEELAHNLGISPPTLYKRKKESLEICEAIKRGKAKQKSYVIGKLMDAVDNGNVTAMIFYLKAHGWRETERQELEVNQPFQFVIKNDLKPDD